MLDRIRTRIVWLTVGLVLGGGALAFAGVQNVGHVTHTTHPKPSVSPSPEPSESEDAPDPKDTTTNDNTGNDSSANRPQNHGFFVSQAAQCKDVNDTTNNVTFTAPADCSTNGKAHGGYVSQVAQSDAGKGPKTHGHNS